MPGSPTIATAAAAPSSSASRSPSKASSSAGRPTSSSRARASAAIRLLDRARELHARGHRELAEHVPDVRFDGLLAEEEAGRDLSVGIAIDDQPGDLELTLAQRLHPELVCRARSRGAMDPATELAQLTLCGGLVTRTAERRERSSRRLQLRRTEIALARRHQSAPGERSEIGRSKTQPASSSASAEACAWAAAAAAAAASPRASESSAAARVAIPAAIGRPTASAHAAAAVTAASASASRPASRKQRVSSSRA